MKKKLAMLLSMFVCASMVFAGYGNNNTTSIKTSSDGT